MSGLVELLGDKLLGKDGEVPTVDALQGKKAIALYFSAHWCPPCRAFTPEFAGWYKDNLKAKGLEVVFISSDKDEDAFNDYYKDMPWLALPYSDREKKGALNKKCKVNGIPSVVILGLDGKIITTEGRKAISTDKTGENIPWIPKTFAEVFSDLKLISSDGTEKKGSDLMGTVFGLYFSAHWCPPCRGFTPKLAGWYKDSLKAKGFEIVFVSSDRDENAFKEYFAEQPWLALDYSSRQAKEELSGIFKVEGIPSFVIIDKDGSVINKEGRAAVSGDPKGEEFPWYPKPVMNFKAGPGPINESPMVIALCEASDVSTQKAIEQAVTPLAEKFMAAAKAAGDDPEIAFAIATEAGGVNDQIRAMVKLDKEEHKAKARLMLMDIPDDGGYYLGPEGDITADVVQKYVDDYKAKKLERKQLEK